MSNISALFIVFGLLLGVTLFWHQLIDKTVEESLVLSAAAVMIGGYICAAMKHAGIIYYIMAVISLIGAVSFFVDYSFVKKEKQNIKYRTIGFFSPSLVMLIIFFLYSVVAFKGGLFLSDDEIFQWGPAVRYMHETSCLPYGTSFTGSDTIFSIGTVFQYIWVGLVPFIERNCMIGNFLLAVIPIFLPFSGSDWKEGRRVITYSIIILLSWNVLSYISYYALLQDYTLPMWAGGIIAWLISRKPKRIDWIVLWGSLLPIGAMKSLVGPLFSCIIILVVMVLQIIDTSDYKIEKKVLLKGILFSLITITSCMCITLIWSWTIKNNTLNRLASAQSVMQKSLKTILVGIAERSMMPVDGSSGSMSISFIIMFVIMILYIWYIGQFITGKEKRLKFFTVFILYAAGFVFYLGIMMYAYIYVFGAADSAIVAGLERYLSYYMLLGSVPAIAVLMKMDGIKRIKSLEYLLILILVIGTRGNTFINKISTFKQNDNSVYDTRSKFAKKCKKISKSVDADENIYILGTISSLEGKIITYELKDRFSWERDCYKMYYRDSSDSKVLTDIIKYPSLIIDNNYDYVWVYNIPKSIKKERLYYLYNLASIKNGDLFKIENNNGKLSLNYLKNIK